MSVGGIGPDRPIGWAVVFAEVLVHDSAHEMVVHRRLQRHPVKLTRAELLESAADVFRPRVRGFGARLPRIIVPDVNDRAFLDCAALHGNNFVFQDGRVVVEVALENRAVGNLDESGGDFDSSERFHLRVFASARGGAGGFVARREGERRQERGCF